MRALEEEVTAEQAVLMGKTRRARSASPSRAKIAIDDFAKVDLRVGLVLSAERVKGSDKLHAHESRLSASRSRAPSWPASPKPTRPQSWSNRKVVIVANLQPRKLKGIESNGMIVAASVEGGKPVLAGFLEDIPVGARLQVKP